jgi:four helix bundle protein
MNRSYEDLKVWRKSIELTKHIYELTSKFPDSEKFGLTNQLRRASVSIASNIAEGCGRNTQGEFVQFLGIASGSVAEVTTQIIIALELGFITQSDFEEAKHKAVEIGKMLSGLKRSIREPNEISLATNN